MELRERSLYTICGLIALAAVCLSSVSQTDLCAKLTLIDCANGYVAEANETVCCSDMNVYPNLCFFAKKKCEDPSLTILYPGDCIFTTPTPSNSTQNDTTQPDSGSSTTTHTPHTEDTIHTVFCLNKDQINCTDELDPVCGTDNNFYANNCEFAKAQCDDSDLRIQDLSVCKTAKRFRRWVLRQ